MRSHDPGRGWLVAKIVMGHVLVSARALCHALLPSRSNCSTLHLPGIRDIRSHVDHDNLQVFPHEDGVEDLVVRKHRRAESTKLATGHKAAALLVLDSVVLSELLVREVKRARRAGLEQHERYKSKIVMRCDGNRSPAAGSQAARGVAEVLALDLGHGAPPHAGHAAAGVEHTRHRTAALDAAQRTVPDSLQRGRGTIS